MTSAWATDLRDEEILRSPDNQPGRRGRTHVLIFRRLARRALALAGRAP